MLARTVSAAVALFVVAALPGAAAAHTDADLVAVAAGDQATLHLKPTHGCDGAPTIEVAIRAPLTGATAGDVDGWTATATDDLAAGTTVLEWTGGSLPPEETGEFPVSFTVPDDVGELLIFPAVQECDNGDELAWIDGDPESEYPAPRILVLPAGSPSAASVDEVAADAPGRDQLAAIVDVDNPDAIGEEEGATGTTTDDGSDVTAGSGAPVTVPEDADGAADLGDTDTPPVGDTGTEAEPAEQDEDYAVAIGAAVVAVLVVGGIAALAFTRRRNRDEDPLT